MKHIISCSDGTWNKPSPAPTAGKPTAGRRPAKEEDTNVAKMYNCICAEGVDENRNPVPQLKLYDQGVGTGVGWKDRLLGGATGAGLDKNIKDIYQFFALNYKPGDRIFLFGFSRGAYTARSLGGLIRTCGVLRPEYLHLVDKAYELYRDRNEYTHPDSDLMRSFRAAYAHETLTPIHFVGVWDTVGSLGLPLPWLISYNMRRYKFHDQTLSSHVRHAYHALAIDEKRKLFAPTLWQKSKSAKADPSLQTMEQRWFAGVHSNVGGGYPDCGLSNLALKWMIEKAKGAGLCFNAEPLVTERPQDTGALVNSYTLPYRLWRPYLRPIDPTDADTAQTVDESVWARWKVDGKKYRPKNLSPLAKEN